jgi:hypothetical protein
MGKGAGRGQCRGETASCCVMAVRATIKRSRRRGMGCHWIVSLSKGLGSITSRI